MSNRYSLKISLTLAAFFLLSIIVIGLFSLFTSPQFIPGFSLAFLAGLSMIFLPCTFPLVFVIVPMALSRHIGKGLVMAVLFFFGGVATKYFALAIFIGVAFGTYSSIFIASALLVSRQRIGYGGSLRSRAYFDFFSLWVGFELAWRFYPIV